MAAIDLGRLVTTIRVTHHVVTRVLLQRIGKAIAAITRRQGGEAHLEEMRRTFGSFRDDLIAHLISEERDVFPYVVALEDAERSSSPPRRAPFRSIAEPLDLMAEEGAVAEQAIEALIASIARARAGSPPDAAWRDLEELVMRLAGDLRVHVALEQDVLRPAALALEATVAGRLRGEVSGR